METRPINFRCPKCGYVQSDLQRDMCFGQPMMIVTTPTQDIKENKDCIVGELGIAYRRRRVKSDKYGEISIRSGRASGAKTERAKILSGDCHSQLFIFEFTDCFVLCLLSDIRVALENHVGYEQSNNDGITSAWYIPLDKIKYWRIEK